MDYIAKEVPELQVNPLIFRNSGGDLETLEDVIKGYHLPPDDFEIGSGLILDLGSHIGLTLADFANRYRGNSIIGVELDKDNYKLARMNNIFNSCVSIECAAITTGNGNRSYIKNEHGNNAHKLGNGDNIVNGVTIDFISHDYDVIEYIKMDIEGEEMDVIYRGGDWPEKTRCIGVEIHEPNTKEDIGRELKRLGFSVQENPLHENSLYGIR